MKSVAARWIVQMYKYVQDNPQIVSGFFNAGIPRAIDTFSERQTVDSDSAVDMQWQQRWVDRQIMYMYVYMQWHLSWIMFFCIFGTKLGLQQFFQLLQLLVFSLQY